MTYKFLKRRNSVNNKPLCTLSYDVTMDEVAPEIKEIEYLSSSVDLILY